MEKKTQKEKVADILKEKGEISNFFAIDTRLTIRLGAIILEGWEINTKMENNNCIYSLANKPTRTVTRPVMLENGKVGLQEVEETLW